MYRNTRSRSAFCAGGSRSTWPCCCALPRRDTQRFRRFGGLCSTSRADGREPGQRIVHLLDEGTYVQLRTLQYFQFIDCIYLRIYSHSTPHSPWIRFIRLLHLHRAVRPSVGCQAAVRLDFLFSGWMDALLWCSTNNETASTNNTTAATQIPGYSIVTTNLPHRRR